MVIIKVKRIQLWLTTGQMVLRATDAEVRSLETMMKNNHTTNTVVLHDTGYKAKWESEVITINTAHIVAFKIIGTETCE